ncbi:MAG: hypothetical protein JWL65_3069 [Gammaproteobacteria bacterium]|nr:hypothetical protein [Gammaproteobacteria bacterium]
MSIRSRSVVTIMLLLSGMACSADEAGGHSEALGSAWADAGKMPDVFSGMWMSFSGMVEDDKKLNVPYTAKAQKYVSAYKPKRDIPYAQEGCMSPGLPIAMRTGPIKFTYAPGLLSIYMQAVGHTRFIKMNQQQGKTAPKYYGNSVGHWEGDTLVVETEDFLPEITFQYGVGKGLPAQKTIGTGNLPSLGGGAGPGGPGPAGGPGAGGGVAALSKAIWGPHGEGMRMVERLRLVNPETLEVNLTIYDDTVWTKPFVTATRNFKRIQKGVSEIGPFSGEPEEWVCTVSITSFDPDTNTYKDKDPEEMVKYLDSLGR